MMPPRAGRPPGRGRRPTEQALIEAIETAFDTQRPRNAFAQPWPWLVLVLALALLAATGAVLGYGWIRHHAADPSSAVFAQAVLLGLGVVALLGVTMVYSLRKRGLQERVPGSLRAWLQSHVFLGGLVLAVALIHAALVPPVWTPTAGKVALVLLGLLVASGIAWRLVYATAPKRAARGEAVGSRVVVPPADRIRDLRTGIVSLTAGGSRELHAAVAARLALPFDQAAVDAAAARIPGSTDEQDIWRRILDKASQIDAQRAQASQQRRHHHVLQDWRWLHVPLALGLCVLIAWHVWSVSWSGPRLSPSRPAALAAFPSSAECGACHGEIYRDWQRSQMADTQLDPVVIAQTNWAVKAHPDQIGLFCNNCHAPVGAQVTGVATLPLDLGFGRNDRRHPVLDDGVSCVACHALATSPGEMHGASADYFRPTAVHDAPLGYRGRVTGPPLGDPPALPVPYHGVATAAMADGSVSSQICGACHNVKVDLEGNEPAQPEIDDCEGVLDENRVDRAGDLILQTTFDEWQDYFARSGGSGFGCVDCHMPPLAPGPIVDAGPAGLAPPDRQRRDHSFPVPLDQAASLDVATGSVDARGVLTATVTVSIGNVGHNMPTGFAFARQWWLEVAAATTDGQPMCLAAALGLASPCASGRLAQPAEDLAYCDVPESLAWLREHAPGGRREVKLGDRPYPDIALASAQPLGACDPWLTSFQTVLTDGRAADGAQRHEVAYQIPTGDAVVQRFRAANGQVVRALRPAAVGCGDASATFDYAFDAGELSGRDVVVTAILHYRRLPPYFVRTLADHLPAGTSVDDILAGLAIQDIASAASAPARIP